MASGGRRKRSRFTLDVNFESDVAKDAFVERLAAVRDLITPPGGARLDNRQFLTSLFELAETTGGSGSSSAAASSLLMGGGKPTDTSRHTRETWKPWGVFISTKARGFEIKTCGGRLS